MDTLNSFSRKSLQPLSTWSYTEFPYCILWELNFGCYADQVSCIAKSFYAHRDRNALHIFKLPEHPKCERILPKVSVLVKYFVTPSIPTKRLYMSKWFPVIINSNLIIAVTGLRYYWEFIWSGMQTHCNLRDRGMSYRLPVLLPYIWLYCIISLHPFDPCIKRIFICTL
jgi:hypothetical protein